MKSLLLSTIIALIFTLTSCTKDNQDPEFRLKEFVSGYLQANNHQTFLAPEPYSNNRSYGTLIEYKNGKVSKVIYKNSVNFPLPTDGSSPKSSDSYHEFSYSGNLVELTQKIDDKTVTYTPQKRLLTVDKKGRIIKRINVNAKDTTEYFYSENGQLSKSIYRNIGGYTTIVRNFFFDSNNNLVRIKGELNNIYGYKYHIFEYFEDFDNGINGFKNLGVIEGAFIRSLSQNNFNTYYCATYDDNNTQLDTMKIRFPVKLDEKGYPSYGDLQVTYDYNELTDIIRLI
jgi:hypothetical protein